VGTVIAEPQLGQDTRTGRAAGPWIKVRGWYTNALSGQMWAYEWHRDRVIGKS